MIVIISDRRRISQTVAHDMITLVAKASGEDCFGVTVPDYADAVRIFTLVTAKPITIDEIRALLKQ